MAGNVSTLDNKTISVSPQPGGVVRWILPGVRRLDPSIFGTPQAPLGFEPGKLVFHLKTEV